MKSILLSLLAIVALLSGCRGISYTEQDAKDGIRQDLGGFALGLKETPSTEYAPYTHEDYTGGLKRVEKLKSR